MKFPRRKQLNPIKVPEKAQQSKLIRRIAPAYPELAKSEHLSGKVILSLTNDEEGNVTDIEVTSGHALLDEAAKTAVSRWKYTPKLVNGAPVPVVTAVTLKFSYAEASGETAISVGE